MVTYLILHYNRPYFLDLLVQTIRKYFHPDPRIVVLDDGSDPMVRESLDWLQVDEIIWNDLGHREDSCCHVIKKAYDSLKSDNSDYIVWSEDDFLLLSNPVDVPPEQAKGEDLLDSTLCPEINCQLEGKFWEHNQIFWDQCKGMLETFSELKLVQVSRPVKPNVKYTDGSEGSHFLTLDHKQMSKYYYTNWPYLARKKDFLKMLLDMPKLGNIERFEFFASKWWDDFGGTEKNYAVAPRYPRYMHIGYSFSQQPPNNKNERRKKSFRDLQKLLGSTADWEGINHLLCKRFAENKFRFRIEQIENRGLGKGMRKIIQKVE